MSARAAKVKSGPVNENGRLAAASIALLKILKGQHFPVRSSDFGQYHDQVVRPDQDSTPVIASPPPSTEKLNLLITSSYERTHRAAA